MTSFEIVPPAEGEVTLTLSWADAEIAARLIGQANYGSLRQVSPALSEFVDDMVKHVGRNTDDEAQNYIVQSRGNQLHVYTSENAHRGGKS